MNKLLPSIMTFCLMVFMMPSPLQAEEKKDITLAEQAEAAIVMEQNTGEIIFEKNMHKKLPPASMTKIMTMLLVMEAIHNEMIRYDDVVRTSEYAASMGGSQIFLEPGEEMTVSDLLKAVAIASANDASVALAEHIAGTEEQFLQMMNEKSKELGLKNTNYMNTNGLPAKDHYTTAYDLAITSKELLKYEEITDFTSMYEDYLRKGTDKEFWLVNTNKLVRFYPGVDGLKTGFTREAKYGLAATAKKDNMRIISVVMGAPTSKERNRQISTMFDYAFNQFFTHTFYERHHPIADVSISKGDKEKIRAITAQPVSLLLKKGETTDGITEKIELNTLVRAPVSAGDEVGKIILEKEGKVLLNIPIIADEDVDAASWWGIFKRVLHSFNGA